MDLLVPETLDELYAVAVAVLEPAANVPTKLLVHVVFALFVAVIAYFVVLPLRTRSTPLAAAFVVTVTV